MISKMLIKFTNQFWNNIKLVSLLLHLDIFKSKMGKIKGPSSGQTDFLQTAVWTTDKENRGQKSKQTGCLLVKSKKPAVLEQEACTDVSCEPQTQNLTAEHFFISVAFNSYIHSFHLSTMHHRILGPLLVFQDTNRCELLEDLYRTDMRKILLVNWKHLNLS